MRLALLAALAPFAIAATARADDAPPGVDVTFATSDGLTIAATYWPPSGAAEPGAPAVVALPMYAQTRHSWDPMVVPVTSRGMALLALDLRGHGDSAKQGDADLGERVAKRDPALFAAMHLDAEAAVAWLAKEKKTPKGRVALLGASVGCSVAIDTAVRIPDDVGAVACLTPGKDYLGVPTMEHALKWPEGRPLLLVTSPEEAATGASALASRLDGKGVELRILDHGPEPLADARALHGTRMFGQIVGVAESVADWLALQIAFRRVTLPGGATVVIGSTGTALYVGLDGAASAQTLTLRVGLGGDADPWSKSETVDVGRRLEPAAPPASTGDAYAAGRRRTRVSRERLGAESGKTFAVRFSLDGTTWFPKEGEPPLVFTLR